MNNRYRPNVKTEAATARMLDRRYKKEKPFKLGAIGEPGRFKVIHQGKRTGVHHFSV